MRLSEIWPDLERTARDAGVLHIGAADLTPAHAAEFAAWINRGHHAGMEYLVRHRDVRLDPQNRYPWARSAIAILVPYSADRPHAPAGALSNFIARYALGDDYHEVLEAILKRLEEVITQKNPEAKTWRYVDTGPLSDRTIAANAGLGWIGRNGMLIHETDGSYFFIGTLLTSLENDMKSSEVTDRCGTCTRCVEACPTQAIQPDRTLDSAQCISYATIEHRGAFENQMGERLEGNVFGCDICQEVCPWNAAPPESHPAFRSRDSYRATPISDLLHMSQSDFSTMFARSAVKRAKLAGMQRNVQALLAE